MEYRVNDSRYQLRAGEGLFCNSNALHAGSQLPGQDCDYLSLTFHPRLLRGFEGSVLGPKYVDALVNSPGLSSAKLTPAVDWQARILRELAAILRLSREKGELYELEVLRGLLEIWAQLYQGFGEAARQDTGEDPEKLRRLRAILTFLHQHYREKVTLEEVARQVGLCKSECCRFFKRQMGVPLFDYLLDYRVGKSLELLQSGCTVAESGAQSGFSTPAYFSKVFGRGQAVPPASTAGRTEGRIKYGTDHIFPAGPQGHPPGHPHAPPHPGGICGPAPPVGGGQGPPPPYRGGPGVLHDFLGPAGGGLRPPWPASSPGAPAPTSSTSAPSPAASKRSKR